MALCREYFPSDTLKLINQSEGNMVRNNRLTNPQTAGEDPSHAAHAIGRHLLRGSPGAGKGKGVTEDKFKNRFMDSPDNLSSVWAGKGEMAILLCELLNSAVGQIGLKALDSGVHRVVVHYLNEGKLATMFARMGLPQFKESAIVVTPAQYQDVQTEIRNKKGELVKILTKKVEIAKASKSANVTAKDIAAVDAVLDRYGAALHLQTFYPTSDVTPSFVDWDVGRVHIKTWLNSKGKVQQALTAAS